MFADMDGFKRVNDSLGHDEGEQAPKKKVVEIIGAVIVGKGKLYKPGGRRIRRGIPKLQSIRGCGDCGTDSCRD